MTPQAGEENNPDEGYFAAIEEAFARMRGTPLVLSPADWHLVASWQERKVPVAVVLRAIQEVFETAAARGRRQPILSLSYCRHAVETEFGRYLEAMAGSDEQAGRGGSRSSLAQRLMGKAERLERAAAPWPEPARELATAACRALRTAAGSLAAAATDPMKLEETLARHERELMDCLEAGLPEAERDSLVTRCRERMAPYGQRMSEEVFQRTLRHGLDTALRQRFKLPRLSLLSD